MLRPGMLTTIQDRGRWGWQHLGVSPGGPMDPWSFRLANILVGNDEWAAALEVTLMGPELRAEQELTVAVTGADLGASVPMLTASRISKGGVLHFGPRRRLTRAYVAVRGGIETPLVLGSRAASLSARLPGLAGRALKRGDTVPVGIAATDAPPAHGRVFDSHDQDAIVRFIWGPDRDRFSDETAETFVKTSFTLSTDSNRMGFRLQGSVLTVREGGQVLSEASPMGSLQVPPSGQPILLMADRQTTGGYARIGTVITADLHVAGQLGPGDAVRFRPCDREEALDALREQEHELQDLRGFL
ncbi:MAG: biotin-dependent carboxyltransferase family protein [Acidobacteriota bacterium]